MVTISTLSFDVNMRQADIQFVFNPVIIVPVERTYPLFGPGVSSGVVFSGAGVLLWISARETSNSASAIVRVWDSLTAGSAPLLWDVEIPTGESREDDFSGKSFSVGLYLEVLSGVVEYSFGEIPN
jgi:hypothetical protein